MMNESSEDNKSKKKTIYASQEAQKQRKKIMYQLSRRCYRIAPEKKGKKHIRVKIFNRFFPQTNTSGVRIGIIADQEGDCNFPDSRIGFGGEFENACGNGASCSAEINTI
ncbi:hypothetical protein pdam_00023881 [Pocillopora damicornis]|uniref:Uncharacterized protein n=1 Tax=Pocillopora damicornis TaxID=46731 RepID=A0A3M6TH08_POCDA|nr:hypothetical protein pdam_00023881 [Pocillopora damicornis]